MGRIIVLIFLIIILAGGGILWFDYLNVIDAKTVLAPVFQLIGRQGRSQPAARDNEVLFLDAERFAIRVEALELRNMELERQEQDIQNRRGEIEQMAQELEERQKALDERENSIIALAQETENKDRNVEQQARYLTGMPPDRAVGIISIMDDQLAVDVLRKTEEIALAEGTSSIVSYWLSLMPPERAREIQRKMVGRPSSLD